MSARHSGFTVPPHINAEAHQKVMEWLEQATPEERRQSLIDAGVLTSDGEIAEPYRTDYDWKQPGQPPRR